MTSFPWALGYFGSRFKLDKEKQKTPVPQGIYELKEQLNQLDNTPAKEILTNIQATLHTKVEDSKDESFLQQFKRLVSYLFGYHRTQETIDEYQYLEQVTLGNKSI
ncbi:MAG: hypothetical protein ACRCXC_04210 [Legionella sp.]